jgi:DNA-binding PadR family transcriptional regulator
MTSLWFTILSAIHHHGPQSDMSLWHQTKCQTLTAVLVAIVDLEDEGYVEKALHLSNVRANASYWQLTEKGRQYIAGNKQQQQEVSPWI